MGDGTDLMASINKILADPESVKQLGELAKSLGLGNLEEPQPSKSEQKEPSSPQTGSLDLSALMALTSAMEKAEKGDKNITLLLALKPHLKAENQGKIDKLIRIFKLMSLYPLLKDSGLVGGDGLGII